ncbi:sugar transferase [Shewanella baltica]|uniref:sugar transferase n=1 Tax=Shewanella baltica TaxID=62322 RepID=UPI000D3A1EED|nr:sugar transferase [Shewanella baltica]
MLKRLFDIFASFVGLIFLIPLFLCVSIWIKLDSNGPVFYRQNRVGRYGKLFAIHKFRTMKMDTESVSRLTIGDDCRITQPGKILRKFKIDELPQLIDVLIGTMSLVGPRPEVQEFIDCYPTEVRDKVLSVRPGITDRASIEMVDESSILANYDDPKKAYIDKILPIKQDFYISYVNENSFLGDLNIIFSTIIRIFNRN